MQLSWMDSKIAVCSENCDKLKSDCEWQTGWNAYVCRVKWSHLLVASHFYFFISYISLHSCLKCSLRVASSDSSVHFL